MGSLHAAERVAKFWPGQFGPTDEQAGAEPGVSGLSVGDWYDIRHENRRLPRRKMSCFLSLRYSAASIIEMGRDAGPKGEGLQPKRVREEISLPVADSSGNSRPPKRFIIAAYTWLLKCIIRRAETLQR